MKQYHSTRPDRPVAVGYELGDVVVTLANGEVLRNPVSWHPWLQKATAEQRSRVEFDADSLYWPILDEGLDIEGLRRGIHSYAVQSITLSGQQLFELYDALDDPKAQEVLRSRLGLPADWLEPQHGA